MTVERPKALLPLVNVPMIAYTLEWLVAAGIEEVRSAHRLDVHASRQLRL